MFSSNPILCVRQLVQIITNLSLSGFGKRRNRGASGTAGLTGSRREYIVVLNGNQMWIHDFPFGGANTNLHTVTRILLTFQLDMYV